MPAFAPVESLEDVDAVAGETKAIGGELVIVVGLLADGVAVLVFVLLWIAADELKMKKLPDLMGRFDALYVEVPFA
jgi:hypothetical protein